MTVSGISSSSITSAYAPPPQQAQQAKAPQQAPKADTVSISKQALQLASDGDPAALEAQESTSERTGESNRGKA